MNNYEHIASEIIKYQVKIIGSVVAIGLAEKVKGLSVTNPKNVTVAISGEPKKVINELVGQCEFLWGNLGVLECKDASEKLLGLLSSNEIPDRLK